MGVVSELQQAPQPDFDESLKVELRGYELARLVGEEWVRVASYRPNQYGWSECLSSGRHLSRLHPGVQYDVRVVVSIRAPREEQVEQRTELAPDPTQAVITESGHLDLGECNVKDCPVCEAAK